MTKHVIKICFALAALAPLIGCGGAIKYPHYYALHVQPPIDPPLKEGVRTSLAVREFQSPAYLRQGAIVYKSSPEEIGFYSYHRWALDPREFVTNAVAEHLRASGNFAQVKLYDGRSDIDCVLSGRLEKLEEVDYGGNVKVEVAISAQMTNLSTGATVWTNQVSEAGAVEQRDVGGVVAEINAAIGRAIDKLLTPGPTTTVARAN
jgi:ABC-type uncharacterized transport system auxiliary subunit